MRGKAVTFAIFSLLFLFGAHPVRAELVVFRVAYKRCIEFSLSENLSQKTSGKIGPGCDFYVDLYAQGEWETTGGYFDTPPYGWGGNVWDKAKYGRRKTYSVSFTCNQPSYTLDLNLLPSYLTKTGEEELPQKGSGFAYPKGRRFKFHMSSSAPTSGSFNLSFSFSTNCQMRVKDGKVYDPAPAVRGSSRCQSRPEININPRRATLSVPFEISDICGPSPTPTLTPTPTITPTPTVTPTLTPTPTPEVPPSCACYLLTSDHKNLTAVKRGDTLNFIAEAYVSTPETAKVLNMVFVLTHEETGSEIANSGEIPAQFKESTVIGGEDVDVYQSRWSYQVKLGEPAGLYHLNLIINCGWKEEAQADVFETSLAREFYLKLRQAQLSPTPTPPSNPFLGLLKRLFGTIVSFVSPQAPTLKLGRFEPKAVPTLPPKAECAELWFQAVE